jgi:hypothetical protein
MNLPFSRIRIAKLVPLTVNLSRLLIWIKLAITQWRFPVCKGM